MNGGLGYEKNGKNVIKERGRFTNMVVPRFDGVGCWQQHLQIVQAIVKSNGWSEGTAELQLFAHLDGEALNVALLMPEEERRKWGGLSNGLSEYFNSPGRLAVFRRRFESTIRRPGVDPATFATWLGILAVRGFGDMGKRARDSMIRDRFIAAQQNCELRRHLDGVPSDTPSSDDWTLRGSPTILGNSDVSRRVCRYARRYVRSPSGPFGRNCDGISSFVGGGWSAIAA